MSQENVELVRRSFEYFVANGRPLRENFSSDFVWDMSTFTGWPERQTYDGIEGVRDFLADWSGSWDDWQLEAEDYLDAGDKVVAIMRQRGHSKASGVTVGMRFASVWTVREGQQTYMAMYADLAEALEAVGLSE